MYSLFGRFSLFFVAVFLSSSLNANSFENFKRSQVDSFKTYKDEKDKLFSTYLKSGWEAYNSKKPQTLYEEPKPKKIVPARHKNIQKLGPKVIIDSGAKKVSEDIIVVEIVEKEQKEQKDIELDFFGTELGFNIPNGMQEARFYPQSQDGITNFFNTVANIEYENLVYKIKTASDTLNLNDWGRYLLVKEVSEKIFSNLDDSKLLSWFIFNKLGYSVKIALSDKHVVLLHHSDKVIYSTPSYTIDKKTFYVVSDYAKKSAGKIFTYRQNYPEADKVFDLSISSLPYFNDELRTKTLSFKHMNKTYAIDYSYNQNLIDFMFTYPQADYETFFNAPMDSRTFEDIVSGLKKHINGKKASVAINFVLNFVQNAFDYEVDNQQFGREKVMFADETLYFNKSDCEDRAILFSYLVKKLFNISVVGVRYKDHMATALYIPMSGDSVKVHSKRFVVADPTYINAIVGQSMPKYKSKIPESFIVVK